MHLVFQQIQTRTLLLLVIALQWSCLACEQTATQPVNESTSTTIDALSEKAKEARGTNPDIISSLADSILSLSKTHNYPEGELSGLYNKAIAAFFENKYEEVDQWCKEIIERTEQLPGLNPFPKNKYLASAYNMQALIFQRTGAYDQSMQAYLAALDHFEQIDDQKNVGVVYSNLAETFRFIKDFSRSMDYNQKAEALYRKEGNLNGLPGVLQNRGNILYDQGKYDEALRIFEETLDLSKEQDDIQNVVNALNNLGVCYEKLNQYDRAIDYYEQALLQYREMNDTWGESNTLGNLSHLNLLIGTPRQAISLSQEALAMAEENNFLELTRFHYENLAKIYEAIGNDKESLSAYKSFVEVRDSLYNQDKFKVISELEQKYNEEKVERVLAQKDKELINTQLQSRQRLFFIIILFIIIFVSLISGFFIVRQSRLRKRINHELRQKNTIIEQKSTEIVQQRDEIKNQKEDLELLVEAYENQREKKIQIGKRAIQLDDIIYIKYHDRVSHLFLQDGRIIKHRVQLSQLLADLKFKSHFFFGQINQNYIINFRKVAVQYHEGGEEKYYFTSYLPADIEEGRNEDAIRTRKRSGLDKNFEKEYQRFLRIKDLHS